jgi:hypothetical protein
MFDDLQNIVVLCEEKRGIQKCFQLEWTLQILTLHRNVPEQSLVDQSHKRPISKKQTTLNPTNLSRDCRFLINFSLCHTNVTSFVFSLNLSIFHTFVIQVCLVSSNA